jgi:hypothetical protein
VFPFFLPASAMQGMANTRAIAMMRVALGFRIFSSSIRTGHSNACAIAQQVIYID